MEALRQLPQLHWAEAKRRRLSASDVLRLYGTVAPPVDIRGLAHWLGVPVYESPAQQLGGRRFDGLVIVATDTNEARIIINASHSTQRQRFTIAHELGHLTKHDISGGGKRLTDAEGAVRRNLSLQGKELAVAFRDTEIFHKTQRSPWAEVEANRFAADLLMPRYLLEAWIQDFNFDTERLARAFKVSPLAMSIRLKNVFPEFFLAPN